MGRRVRKMAREGGERGRRWNRGGETRRKAE